MDKRTLKPGTLIQYLVPESLKNREFTWSFRDARGVNLAALTHPGFWVARSAILMERWKLNGHIGELLDPVCYGIYIPVLNLYTTWISYFVPLETN